MPGIMTYPPRSSDFTGAVADVIHILNTPRLVERRIRDIAQQRYISDQLFTEGGSPQGGAIQYEQNESIFAEGDPEVIEPLGKFPLSQARPGTTAIATAEKLGHDGAVSLEAVLRRRQNPLTRETTKLANNVVRYVDSRAMAVAAAAPLQTLVGADWTAATADAILRQLAEAKALIVKKNEGYVPDTLVIDDDRAVDLVSKSDIAKAIDHVENPPYSGTLGRLMGLTIMVTPNLVPAFAAGTMLVLDRDQFGERADEVPFQATSWWVNSDEHGDEYWRLRAKRHPVHYVTEPDAGVKITGT